MSNTATIIMPSHRHSRRSRGQSHRPRLSLGQSALVRTVTVPFRDVTTVLRTSSAGYEISTINLNIASFTSGSRVRTFAGLYEFFRFKDLSVRTMCDASGVPTSTATATNFIGLAHGVGFVPSAAADLTSPVTFSDLMNMPNATMGPASKVLGLKMGPRALYQSSPTKWYHTSTTGTPPVADSSVGTIVYITRSSNMTSVQSMNSYIELTGVVEYKAPLPLGDTIAVHSTSLGDESTPSGTTVRDSSPRELSPDRGHARVDPTSRGRGYDTSARSLPTSRASSLPRQESKMLDEAYIGESRDHSWTRVVSPSVTR